MPSNRQASCTRFNLRSGPAGSGRVEEQELGEEDSCPQCPAPSCRLRLSVVRVWLAAGILTAQRFHTEVSPGRGIPWHCGTAVSTSSVRVAIVVHPGLEGGSPGAKTIWVPWMLKVPGPV